MLKRLNGLRVLKSCENSCVKPICVTLTQNVAFSIAISEMVQSINFTKLRVSSGRNRYRDDTMNINFKPN